MTDVKTARCLVDGREFPFESGMYLYELDRPLANQIKNEHPKANDDSFICNQHLLDYRMQRIDQMIRSDQIRNQKINRRLTKALRDDNYEVTDVNQILRDSQTFGEKVADGVAHFGGSWTFILIFLAVLIGWMVLNVTHLFGIHFDPYPFILLNLCLSCVAAIQAPIIMMSQNRSDNRDRMDAENDFHVNLKSEHELRILHAKLDHLNQSQIPHSVEILRLQLEMIGEIRTELQRLHRQHAELSYQQAQMKSNKGVNENGRQH
ncbi:DUF1003 domain-containing protein [Nicoliella lavandulae]|uniref:DUF1003 domain-containing protein n=1 Tax=Nicoliella lavandulae TaxID=3082954 RepID=A0ABU8SIE6_9LACO